MVRLPLAAAFFIVPFFHPWGATFHWKKKSGDLLPARFKAQPPPVLSSVYKVLFACGCLCCFLSRKLRLRLRHHFHTSYLYFMYPETFICGIEQLHLGFEPQFNSPERCQCIQVNISRHGSTPKHQSAASWFISHSISQSMSTAERLIRAGEFPRHGWVRLGCFPPIALCFFMSDEPSDSCFELL